MFTPTTLKLALAVVGVVGFAELFLIPLPLRIGKRDKEEAVAHTLLAVLREQAVRTNKGYQPLEGAALVWGQQLFFQNELGIPDAVFLKYGLKPAPKAGEFRLTAGDAVICFSYYDLRGSPAKDLELMFISSTLDIHAYAVRIRKSLLTRRFTYSDK
jgi:hypothetical protein